MLIIYLFQVKDLCLGIVCPTIRAMVSQIKTLQENAGPTPYLDQVETLIAGANEFKGVKLLNSPQIISSFQKGY